MSPDDEIAKIAEAAAVKAGNAEVNMGPVDAQAVAKMITAYLDAQFAAQWTYKNHDS